MATVKMLALGDSVVWGQGLSDAHKFVHLVQSFLARGGNTVELASLARSGAIIDLASQPATPHTSFLFGELPRSLPGILTELSVASRAAGFDTYLQPNSWDRGSWKAVKQDLTRQIAGYASALPDYILLDGGINDFRALQVVLPWSLHDGDGEAGVESVGESNVEKVLATLDSEGMASVEALPELHWMTEQEFKDLIDKFLFERMRGLLAQVGPAFPTSRVIVTGYYPIFTPGSLQSLLASVFQPAVATLLARSPQREEQLAALAWALNWNVDPAAYANQVLLQSRIWYEYGTERLREAVAEANVKFGNRFALASPVFGPDNGALAPDSLLWTLTPAVDAILREILRLFGGGGVAATEEEMGVEGIGQAFEFSTGYGLGAGLATDEATGARALSAFKYYVRSSTGRNDPDATFFGGFTTSVASAGHPNPKGAAVFAAAIEPLL